MEKWFHWIECNIAIALLLRKTVLYFLAWSRWSNYLSLTSAALCKLSALHPVGGETPCPVSQTMSHLLLWIKLCHVSIGQHHMNTGCNKIVKDPRKISWYRYSVWRLKVLQEYNCTDYKCITASCCTAAHCKGSESWMLMMRVEAAGNLCCHCT